MGWLALPRECGRSWDHLQTQQSLCLQVAQLVPTKPRHHHLEYLCVWCVEWVVCGVGGVCVWFYKR